MKRAFFFQEGVRAGAAEREDVRKTKQPTMEWFTEEAAKHHPIAQSRFGNVTGGCEEAYRRGSREPEASTV